MKKKNYFFKKAVGSIYKTRYNIKFKDKKLNFSDYPQLNELGIWLSKEGSLWMVIPNNQALTLEGFTEEFQNSLKANGILDMTFFELEKSSSPFLI